MYVMAMYTIITDNEQFPPKFTLNLIFKLSQRICKLCFPDYHT